MRTGPQSLRGSAPREWPRWTIILRRHRRSPGALIALPFHSRDCEKHFAIRAASWCWCNLVRAGIKIPLAHTTEYRVPSGGHSQSCELSSEVVASEAQCFTAALLCN